MMSYTSSGKSETTMIERIRFVELMKAGLESKSYQFIRQATMVWLASYPGDLEVNYLLAQALIKEGRDSLATPILDKILRTDTEFVDALKLAEAHYLNLDGGKAANCSGLLQALGYAPANAVNLPGWGTKLYLAAESIKNGALDSAKKLLMDVMTAGNAPSLAGILHLKIAVKENDLTARLNLGRVYHSRWPDCVQISLLLAKSWMEGGNQDEAVNLLHECAALDPTGQIPMRLWGSSYEFKPLYPAKMQVVESFAIPAVVSSKLGLNHLASGGSGYSKSENQEISVTPTDVEKPVEEKPAETIPAQTPLKTPPPLPEMDSRPFRTEVTSFDGYQVLPDEDEEYPENPKNQAAASKPSDPAVDEVKKEFERMAVRLKTPASARSDSRFPVYVIVTTKTGLSAQYGAQSAQVILDELDKLAESVRKTNNWHSMVFMPDDLTVCGRFGITPVDAIDPWKIKLALTDLDKSLAKTGEMVGAVLIAGGEKIVPFHKLPNPTDDSDATVPSDNPYGSLDKNYYVGDWPVGRLPGDASSDSGLLLTQIRNLTDYHMGDIDSNSWINQVLRFILSLNQIYARNFTNVGETAAIWQRASISAFRAIGEERNLFLSPQGKNGIFNSAKLARAPFAYFNVHGVEDGPNWYGQKDTSDTSTGEDYPVALQPTDLTRNGASPRIVFSEACYGGHIVDRKESESIALTFLGQGVLGMIASSTIAYGSVTTPLIGADLLANIVLKYLVEGQPIGTAFLKAKVDFVREMNLRQGYLDGEDQKTLISFILYGDPLVSYDPYQVSTKVSVLREKDHPIVKTVVDQSMDEMKSSPISAKAIANAKATVSQYLPGIDYAEVHISKQHVRTNNNLPSMNGQAKGTHQQQASRMVVSFSKQINFDQHIHKQFARVTMDQQGKVIKLAISK